MWLGVDSLIFSFSFNSQLIAVDETLTRSNSLSSCHFQLWFLRSSRVQASCRPSITTIKGELGSRGFCHGLCIECPTGKKYLIFWIFPARANVATRDRNTIRYAIKCRLMRFSTLIMSNSITRHIQKHRNHRDFSSNSWTNEREIGNIKGSKTFHPFRENDNQSHSVYRNSSECNFTAVSPRYAVTHFYN